jgi:hypothetical protein
LGKLLQKQSLIIIEEESEEATPNPTTNDNTLVINKHTTIDSEQPSSSKEPPYPERLSLNKPVARFEYDLITRLKIVCIKIPLLQALKDIPIYAK